METKVYRGSIGEAPEILKKGGLVAVPTETVYGLAANGLDASAVEKVYEVKGRPAVKPLSLMIPSPEVMDDYAHTVPHAAHVLAEKFWPGPLTIVLPARENIPPIVLSGGKTVGLRCPDNDLTLAALKASGVPFAAPSANMSGGPSPKTAQEVLDVFDGRIDAVIDGGPCTLGRESTILDMSSSPYRILRQGALPENKIADALVVQMTIIGITGKSGSGKSSALLALEPFGALQIDCDEVYHTLVKDSGALLQELYDRFPLAFSSGAFDRKALGKIVFADAAALKDLNAIAHRHVLEEVRRRLRRFAMQGGEIAAIDAVELFSSGADELCSFTIAVLASKDKCLARIMERDGISAEYAESRILAQKSDDYYRENCTYTVYNDGTEEQLKDKIFQLIKENQHHG